MEACVLQSSDWIQEFPILVLEAPVAWRHGRTVEFPVVDWPGMTTVGNRSYDGCVHVSMRAMSTTASNGAERIGEQYSLLCDLL